MSTHEAFLQTLDAQRPRIFVDDYGEAPGCRVPEPCNCDATQDDSDKVMLDGKHIATYYRCPACNRRWMESEEENP